MRNTGKKTNLRFIVQSILFVCMVLSPYSSHAKLSYNKTEWNGSATVKVEGNYATVVANGLNGAIEFKGITVSEFDVPSSIISQTYGTTIQTISDLTTTFGVYYDAKTKILHVKTTPYTGAISIENDGVCYQTDAEMSVVNVDLADYAIEWGTANGTDTTWIPSAKNQKDVSYTMDTLNPVRFVTKLTPASANGNVIVNELIVSPVLFGCGFSMGVSDNTICLSKDVTLSTSYTNASKYEWKDDDGRIYATTNVPTATITPEKSGTYEFAVYGDGLKIASSQVRVKSMGECGFKVTAAKEYVCLGASVEISTDFTEASSYVLMDENNKTVATSLTPSITFIPTENSTYSLYADNFFVGKVSIKVKECTFFIAPKYPIASCLQDTNILMAAGTAVLDDIEKNVFTWERSENNIDWKLLPTTSYRLPIATTEDYYYKLTYNGLTEVLFYPKPDCSNEEYCDGLETKTLFYETFGFFMSEDVYVSDDKIFVSNIDVDHTTSVTLASKNDSVAIVKNRYSSNDPYYTARKSRGDAISVDMGKTNSFDIRHFVTPDPYGRVVTATKFVNSSDANQFVGTNGHLFITENPMLRQYESDTWVSDASLRLQDGYYAIVANPDSCDHNKNANDFISCNDYTGNRNGAMLFVNAGQTSISKSAIYAQEAPLACPADRFNFGMSIRNATYVEEDEWKLPVNLTICLLKEFNESARVLPSENDPNVLARISSGDVLAGDDWYRVNEFVSLTDKTDNLWVVIYNNGADGDGNDMILDDITFSVCIPKSQLFATMNGDTLNSNVLTCSGDAVTLHAIQTSSYLENPYYIFQFQKVNGGDTVWTDLNDYKNHPELMRVDTVDVSTNESDFWGKLSYRVIISDDATIARKVADGEYASLTECEFTYHQASTEITIQNTYGGEMAPRDSVAFCNIDGTKVSVRGERKLTKPDHEWTMSWLAADSSVIYTKNVKGVSVDTLTLTVLKGNKFSVKSSDGKDLEERSFPELDSLFFRAIDEGGCEFFQTIVLHEKMNLDVKPTIDTVITDCNSVTVKVQRNYSEPPLRFDWSSVEGDATIVDDTTQTFAPKFVENFSVIDGVAVVTPVNVDDKYCFLQDTIKIPYSVHNGKYELEVLSSKDPVCVSTNSLSLDAKILTLTAKVKTNKMSNEEATKLQGKIKSYKWNVTFEDGSVIDTTTIANELSFSNRDFLSSDLTQIKSKSLKASIVETTTDVCNIVTNTSDETVDVEIREGGFSLTLASDKSICLKEKKRHDLQIIVSPATALLNIDHLDLYRNNEKLETLTNLKDTIYFGVNVEKYPNIFKSGSTSEYKISVYDETCKNDNESNPISVKYNGYDWRFNRPDSCLTTSDATFKIVATIDSLNATNHIQSYRWMLNDQTIQNASGLSLNYPVKESMTGSFKLITSDNICPDVEHAFTSNISINYEVAISSESTNICSTDSVEVLSVVTPESSRKHIKSYKWIVVDTLNGNEKTIKNGSKEDVSIMLSKVNFPELFKAGNAFKLYVVTDDEICDPVTSTNKITYKVNEPFTLSLASDRTKICYQQGDEVKLKVSVSPADAVNHIEKFTWIRKGNDEEMTTETEGDKRTELTISDLTGWMTPAHGVKFMVGASDGICSTGLVTDDINLDINVPFEVGLSADKTFACSVNDHVLLTATSTQTSSKYVNFTYKYEAETVAGSKEVAVRANPTSLSEKDTMDKYKGLNPSDVITYRLTVSDGGVCEDAVSNDVNVTIQTPFKVHIEAERYNVCENDNIKMWISSITPSQSAEFIKMYSWQQVDGGSVGLINDTLRTSLPALGSYKYFSNISDGICYGTEKFLPLQSDTVTIKVNTPIEVHLDLSSNVYCQSSSSEPFYLEVNVSKGEPIAYELLSNKGLIERLMTTDKYHRWQYNPSSDENVFSVWASDGVCPAATDPNGSKSVDVHQPIEFKVTIPEEDYAVCLGESVHFTTEVVSGNPAVFLWTGMAIDPTASLPTVDKYLEDIPNVVGDVYYQVTAMDYVCPSVTFDVPTISVHQQPVIDLSASKTEVVIGSTIDLTTNVVDGQPVSFSWVMNGALDLGTSDINTIADIKPSSSSWFTAFASDGVCPVASAETSITVIMPTAFTPYDRDGYNDIFMEGFDVQIFDRYGMKVFEGNNGWNGRKGNVMADPGVYFCSVILKDGKTYKGTIEIVKID